VAGLYGGSTGQTSAERVERTIEAFYGLPLNSQTSAVFATKWSSRGAEHLAQSAAGWMAYLQRVLISTANTSTQGRLGTLGLPHPVWTDFVADHATLKAESTHESGTTDADQGRRVYEFLVSSVINSNKWRTGTHREFLSAWGAAGSSALPTS
jgi:hypothetical protein